MIEKVLHCPACGGRFSAAAHFFELPEVVFLCGSCGSGFSQEEAGNNQIGAEALSTENQHEKTGLEVVKKGSALQPRGRVIVGHALPAAQRVVCDVLRAAGFAPACVGDGNLAVQACDPVMPERPVALVLDVGVTEILAFEVISHVRAFAGCENLPIVLLASVYERTRYKRRPNRLYGANAYLELHHVPDQLGQLVTALVADKEPPVARAQTPADRARSAPLRTDGSSIDAQALAHRLISDVALYNGDELAKGVAEKEALKYVQDAISEAKERYVQAFNDEAELSSFQKALDAFVVKLFARDVAHESVDSERELVVESSQR